MDAFLATFLLIIAVIIVTRFSVVETSTEQIDFISQDVLSSISELKVSEIDNLWVKEQIANGNISNQNKSVLAQIGAFWALGKMDYAENLTIAVIGSSISEKYSYAVTIEDDVIYTRNNTVPTNLITYRRMVAGVQEAQDVEGSSSSAHIRRLRDKKMAAYFYFGGFVGQGNISILMSDLPYEIGSSDVEEITLEADVVSDFNFYINGHDCGLFSPTLGNASSDMWDLTSCKTNLNSSINDSFEIKFNNEITNSYVAGGYLKVIYNTTDFNEQEESGHKTYFLPGIKGIINLFDSFYIPGNLLNLTLFLHYDIPSSSNNTFYLTIGNETIFYDNTSTLDQQVLLTDINFSNLNYSLLSLNTVPIRIGFENLTFKEVIVGVGEGFGDIVLTTDVSGSMDYRFDADSSGTARECNDTNLFSDSTKRISVAKCLDKDFITDVIENTTLNRISLISYDSSTDSSLNLTNDEDILYSEIESYNANSYTCVACGIASGRNNLLDPPSALLIKNDWKFSTNYQTSNPPSGWNNVSFNDLNWSEGKTSFGYNNGETTALISNDNYAELWENSGDIVGPPVDFSSGILNQSNNDFRNLLVLDGWDSTEGSVYDGDGANVRDDGIVGGSNKYLRMYVGGSNNGNGNYQTSAGAYGILVNITPEMYQVIQDGGYVAFSFVWSWIDDGKYENGDEVWIKSSITNTTGDRIYLGSEKDSGHLGGDSYNEIYASEDPDGSSTNQLFSEDISQYITEPGLYYFDFGGKLLRESNSEDGYFYFDNIQLEFVSIIGNTYYRNNFEMNTLSRFSNIELFVSSDDGAEIYLNGDLLVNDSGPHSASYWNVNSFVIDPDKFEEGDNVLAVKLYNDDFTSGFFDLELRGNMSDRQKAIVIMSDGDANRCIADWTSTDSGCNDCGGYACCPDSNGNFNSPCPSISGVDTAADQVINLSCYLKDVEGVSIYTVAFGDVSFDGKKTLNLSAACDNVTHFYTSSDVSGLSEMYDDIAQSIVQSFTTRQSQVIISSGQASIDSTLFNDSYIQINYDPVVPAAYPNEISVVIQESNMNLTANNNCSTNFSIHNGLRVIDSKVTVYSSDHWANLVKVDNTTVFNLSEYNKKYITLGDPFIVQIPPNLLTSGNHSLLIQTGDDNNNFTGCSANNSLIYKGVINSSISRTDVKKESIGCKWFIEIEDGSFVNHTIPGSYTGPVQCAYTNLGILYKTNDAYDLAVHSLLKSIDLDNDGRILFNLFADDIEIIVSTISGVPYLWGPSIVEVRIWQ